MEDEVYEKMKQLAREILVLSRNTLLVNLRFLDNALSRFTLVPTEYSSLLTDGRHLFFNPKYVLARYRTEQQVTVRDYLHMVLHGVFRHMYMDPSLNRPYWDLACDIAVENIISELGLSAAASVREKAQADTLAKLRGQVKTMTAEKLYRHLVSTVQSPGKVASLRGLFYADNHEIWYMTLEEISVMLKVTFLPDGSAQEGEGKGSGEDKDGKGQGSGKGKGQQSGDDSGSGDGSESGEDGKSSTPDFRSQDAQDWKDISEKMQMDLETFSAKLQGSGAGNLMQSLNAVNREKYDYTAFLRKFATMGEVMKINDDEFDYVFYTYGLRLYEKMPLVEPLEYKEVRRIKEFVIAIDTSGSTSGELVQAFVQKTYNVLKSTESFFSKINLHIVQCDAKVQEHVKITSQEEFDQYLKTMKIRGLGGTDFRPVFKLVDELIAQKEFRNLKGLIYFTDGYGTFPARKPDYDTAFVFVQDEYNNPDVPPWAIKLVLEKDEI